MEAAGQVERVAAPAGLALRLFGPLQVQLAGVAAALPPSRKVRALLAYLALVGRPVTRSHLCELLWDLPSDPRGELRWSLSKLRSVLGGCEPAGVVATGDTVALHLPPGCVDALEVTQALHDGISTLPLERLRRLAGLGDGMAHDLITRLAKLRSMFVIAEGTMFALSERQVGSEDAARRLAVDYVASGFLRRLPGALLQVSVQLAETRSAKVVWAQEFSGRLDDTFTVVDEIGNRIVTAIAQQVEVAERNRAILKNPNSLNAWEAHHRGLWHMVRFARDDNEQARHFFQTAVRLDPTFARPLAGLSFTHFQDAFQGWREPGPAIELAYRTAAEGLMADESDPATHWALGRAMWLKGRAEHALVELQSSIDLSPNFALAHYNVAFVQAQSGDPEQAIAAADHARALSPMDPLLFGMLASRALALIRLGRYDEAADAGVRAAARPNAHVHIQAIALFSLALAGRMQEAADIAKAIRRSNPGYSLDEFLKAFQICPELLHPLRGAAQRVLG
jgi:TolB-like protein